MVKKSLGLVQIFLLASSSIFSAEKKINDDYNNLFLIIIAQLFFHCRYQNVILQFFQRES